MSKERLETMLKDGVPLRNAASICGISYKAAKALIGQEDEPEEQELDIKELARKATPAAIKALKDIVTDLDASPASRVAAASAILDRAYGKPAQEIEHTGGVMVTLGSVIKDAWQYVQEVKGQEILENTPPPPPTPAASSYILPHSNPALSPDLKEYDNCKN